jgi:hypothetical protein
MTHTHPSAWTLFGLIAGFLLACGDDNDSPTYASICHRACERAAQCHSTVDANACSENCREEFAEVGPNLSATYLSAVDACIAESTCAQLASAAVLGTCDLQARVEVSPSATVQSFCTDVSAADRFCSRIDRELLCREGMKVFSDAAISRARPCLDESCDQQEPCVESTLGTEF